MGVFSRLFGKAEKRSSNLESFLLGNARDDGDVVVTEENITQYAAAYACGKVISETVCSLPWAMYRKTPDGGREKQTSHPYNDLVKSAPNENQTASEFFQDIVWSTLFRGNGYAEIAISSFGMVESMDWIHPNRVTPKKIDGAIFYKVAGENGAAARMLPAEKVLHIRGASNDGVVGLSVIDACRQALEFFGETQEYGIRMFRNNTHLGVVFKTEQTLTEDQIKVFEKTLGTGTKKAGKSLVLFGGLEPVKMGLSSRDAQFLEIMQYGILDICRIFRVQPHKIMDLSRATFSNIEQQSIDFVNDTILPLVVRIEQRLNKTLLTPDQRMAGDYFKADLRGLMRGDSISRGQYYSSMVQNGIYTRNEVREMEEMNPMEGGDTLTVQQQMAGLGEKKEDGDE